MDSPGKIDTYSPKNMFYGLPDKIDTDWPEKFHEVLHLILPVEEASLHGVCKDGNVGRLGLIGSRLKQENSPT